MTRFSSLLIPLAILTCMPTALAQSIPIANPSFEEGTRDTVPGWTLSGTGSGARESGGYDGTYAITVSGEGEDHNFWLSDTLPFEPGGIYILDFFARRMTPGTGSPVSGAQFANVDYPGLSEQWEAKTNIFMAPDQLDPETSRLRFGQWHDQGVVAFDAIRLYPAQAVYRREGDIVLGDGESIDGDRYVFDAPFQRNLSNHSRPLQRYTCWYNTNRMVFGRGTEAIFLYEIPGHAQTAVTITGKLHIEVSQGLDVSVSTDGTSWQTIGAIATTTTVSFEVPSDMLPADRLWVRMSTPDEIDPNQPYEDKALIEYRYTAQLDHPAESFTGSTTYFRQTGVSPMAEVKIDTLAFPDSEGDNPIGLLVTNTQNTDLMTSFTVGVTPKNGQERLLQREVTLAPGQNQIDLSYDCSATGTHCLRLSGVEGFEAIAERFIPDLYASGYGRCLPSGNDALDLWWASSGWKISRFCPVPDTEDTALRIELAANEAEAAQFVIRPRTPLHGVLFTPQTLTSSAGDSLPASAIEVLRVGYVHITTPTDATGAAGDWPDPLIPTAAPLDLTAGENQPFWVRVTVPANTPAGVYKGTLAMQSEGSETGVPLEVQVFGFSLPDTPTCESAIGYSPVVSWWYHKATTDADRRAVTDAYMRCYASHRLSPYDPAPMDPFGVTRPDIHPGDPVTPEDLVVSIDWSAWDRAMEQAMNERHMTAFQLPSPGMGSGTFYDRYEPEIQGFTEDTPEYQALFKSYYSQVEAHLKEKGWLDRSYIYWFDEPEPKDYDFVMNGFRKLEDAAPGIPRMLTEQIEPDLVGGPNLWCPILDAFPYEKAAERRAEGDRFWWYVCTGPKAPYLGLFIDRPATDLRVWLWQTWMHDIDGILIWTSNYWHSESAYPDGLQDPYADPMSWVQGYGTGVGVRLPWGNGDGRFFYPPEPREGDAPDLRDPVVSIRWEMLRDGIEDYEYLTMLRRLLDEQGATVTPEQRTAFEALLTIPETITRSVTEYTRTPIPIEEHRRAVAEAVEVLSR